MASRWSQVNVGRRAITRYRSPEKQLKHYKRSKWTALPEMYKNMPKLTQRVRPLETRRAIKRIKERDLFIDLCRKHIMNGQLANVFSTAHMESPRTTLFLIGEQHAQHHKCTSIPEMFSNLFMDNVRAGVAKNAVTIDVLIEVLQSTVVESHDSNPAPDDSYGMIDNVRMIFQTCMARRTCPPFVRVHWADPTETFYPPGKRDKNIHSWLNKFTPYPLGSDEWMKDDEITSHLSSFYDAHKLLTENRIVVKEIGKACLVNPAFTQEFALEFFMKIWAEQRKIHLGTLTDGRPRVKGWEKVIPLQLRRVMDIYTAARIVKLKMRHCIFYGGENHLKYIQRILEGLDFRSIQTFVRDRSCF